MTVIWGMLASIVSNFCCCHRHDAGMLACLFYSFIKGQRHRQLFFAMDILPFRALTPRVCDCVLLQLISKSCQSCIKMTHQLCNYRARWCLTFSSLFVFFLLFSLIALLLHGAEMLPQRRWLPLTLRSIWQQVLSFDRGSQLWREEHAFGRSMCSVNVC